MPIIIRCPDCGNQLRVRDEQLGKKVRCPGCKEVFTAEDEDEATLRARIDAISDRPITKSRASADYEVIEEDEEDDRSRRRRRDDYDDEDDEDDEDRPKKKASPRQGWKKVRLGLTLYLIGIFTALGGFFLICLTGMVVGGTAVATGSAGAAAGGLIVLGLLGILIALSWRGLWTGGMIVCMFVPDRPNTSLRFLGILNMCLCLGSTLFWMLSSFVALLTAGMGAFASSSPVSYGGEINVAQIVLEILGLLCMAGWMIVFILYMRAIAFYLRDYDLASTLMKYLISVAVFLVLAPITLLISLVLGGALGSSSASGGIAAAGIMILLVGSAILIAYICLGIWHIVLVFQVRTLVDRRVRH
jgi:predicted Zn finger-like uncharacterized protein